MTMWSWASHLAALGLGFLTEKWQVCLDDLKFPVNALPPPPCTKSFDVHGYSHLILKKKMGKMTGILTSPTPFPQATPQTQAQKVLPFCGRSVTTFAYSDGVWICSPSGVNGHPGIGFIGHCVSCSSSHPVPMCPASMQHYSSSANPIYNIYCDSPTWQVLEPDASKHGPQPCGGSC